jgi:hypothetical protein
VLPEVPVIVSGKVPAADDDDTGRDRVAEALPPAGGVTPAGEKEPVTPLGADRLRLVSALKPFELVTVTVALPLPPCVTLSEEGATVTLKSGEGLVTVKVTALDTGTVFPCGGFATVTDLFPADATSLARIVAFN